MLRNGIYHSDLRWAARFLPRHAFAGPGSLRLTRALTQRMPQATPGVSTEHVDAHCTARIHQAGEPTGRGLLWIHGGGLVSGVAAQDDGMCRRFAHAISGTVAAVDYRLAPEHPYPAAIEDCYAALVWLAQQPGIDPTRIAVGGTSAGGGLAAALALMARDRGEIAPAFQLLVYPMLDDRTAATRDVAAGSRRMWDNKANRFGWESYLATPCGTDGVDAYAAPARSTDLTRLPPAWIGVGSLDLFHDEANDYARRLRAGGTPCELHVVQGAFHAFDYLPRTAIGKQFQQAQIDALVSGLEAATMAG